MITEYQEKGRTRKLYEDTFDDPKEFVDYYYADKCMDNRMIVSLEDDEVISMLHLNPYRVSLCGAEVQSYYVVAVATKEDRRHEGQMSKVFQKAFEILRSEHVPFVFLLPVDEAIYTWMGFEKICDYSMGSTPDYDDIREKYDVYCIRDDTYLRRMRKEEELRAFDKGSVFPDHCVIMAKITDLDKFNEITGSSFTSEKEALKWLRSKKIYICEEV